MFPNDCFSQLIVHKQQHDERDGREPPHRAEVLHLETVVEAGDVDEDKGDEDLEEHGEVQDPVVHTALEYGQAA